MKHTRAYIGSANARTNTHTIHTALARTHGMRIQVSYLTRHAGGHCRKHAQHKHNSRAHCIERQLCAVS